MTEETTKPELEPTLVEAARLSGEGLHEAALESLLDIESDYPENATLLCMIGALASHLGGEGMAADFFRRALAQNPTDPELLITAGSGLAALGDPGAEPALRLAALSNPEMPAARMHYGAVLLRNGMLREGLDELLAARALDAEDPEIRRNLGIGYLLADRPDEALEELESAAAADPENPELRTMWGLALLGEKEIAQAAEELYPIAEVTAQDGQIQLIMALTFAAEGWDEHAWLALSRAEAIQPPIDGASIREVEEAIEAGEDAARDLLLEELAPSALRDRIFLG